MSTTTIRRKSHLFLLSLLLFCFCFFILGPSMNTQAARATATVKNNTLNVRAAASTSSSIICKLSKGAKVTIISETTGDDGMKWYDVFYAYKGEAMDGFVRADLVKLSGNSSGNSSSTSGNTSSGSTSASASGTRYIKGDVVRVRSYASTDADIRSRLTQGTKVTLLSSKTGADGKTWYKVSYTSAGSQLTGYIRSDMLTEGTGSNTSGNSSSGSSNSAINKTALIKPVIVNIRSYASTNGDIRSKLSQGTSVTIKEEKIGDDGLKWYKITYTYNGASMSGYVRSDLVTLSSSANNSSGSSSSSSSSSSSGSAVAQVRSYASPHADIRATLENGTKVTILKEKQGEDGQMWTKISFTQNGQKLEGYVPSSLLK